MQEVLGPTVSQEQRRWSGQLDSRLGRCEGECQARACRSFLQFKDLLWGTGGPIVRSIALVSVWEGFLFEHPYV